MTIAPPTLRAARLDDCDAIAAIWHRGWREAHDGRVPEALAAHRRLGDMRRGAVRRVDATRLATQESAVVGFVMTHADEVEHLYVAPGARGTGAATLLLAHAETSIAERSAGAWLAVVSANLRARRFYERSGWVDAGEFMHRAKVEGGAILVATRRYEKTFG